MNKKILAIIVTLLVIVALGATYALISDKTEKPAGKIAGNICTMDYNPVCGSDGITYGNACMAGQTPVAYVGECNSSNSGTPTMGVPAPGSNNTPEMIVEGTNNLGMPVQGSNTSEMTIEETLPIGPPLESNLTDEELAAY